MIVALFLLEVVQSTISNGFHRCHRNKLGMFSLFSFYISSVL